VNYLFAALPAFMQVHFTDDVEIRADDWTDRSGRLFAAFRRLPYGPPRHQGGALQISRDNGQRAVFFVEPLFSYDCGLDTLQELIGLIRFCGHTLVDRFFGWAGSLSDRYVGRTKVRRLIRGNG
jgi:hypothetical protein